MIAVIKPANLAVLKETTRIAKLSFLETISARGLGFLPEILMSSADLSE